MGINSYFTDFLSAIRMTPTQRSESKKGHTTLRDRLMADEDLKDIIITTFLQGSYKRSTAIKPLGDKRADVDVIVVTNLNKDKTTPKEALKLFETFADKHYKGKWKPQGRSIGIELSYVDLDIVVTSAPSEADQEILKSASVRTDLSLEDMQTKTYDWRLTKSWLEPDLIKGNSILSEAVRAETEWKSDPLLIPDRDAGTWEKTHPLEQIRWTREKNKKTSGHYINVVKAFKWWRTLKLTDLKYPKGYPVEHMLGDCCPDGVTSVAEGITLTLEAFVTNYSSHRLMGSVPKFPDRGVPEHNVWHRITFDDFKKFYDAVKELAKAARMAYDEKSLRKQTEQWQKIFGDKFPLAPEGEDGGDDGSRNSDPSPLSGFTPRTKIPEPKQERFA